MNYDAIVIAGGGARRLGGVDKMSVTVGGRTLLDRTLSACADAASTTVVGPRRPTVRRVGWALEEPPGSGPLAALEAGLRHCTAEVVLVLSADLPFLDAGTVRELLAPAAEEGALLFDGRDQPLVAAYRADALRRELALSRVEYGSLAGLPMRLLLPGLSLRRVPVPVAESASSEVGAGAAVDCDTWEDIASARARIREHGSVLDEWTTAVMAELGIELDLGSPAPSEPNLTAALLDLARDAAHSVARPAAPLTTFLVGYAAAQRGGSPEEVARAARQAAELARRWVAEEHDERR
ncbi:molybdenum cofactor guanylyltransferase [Streptomyces sp. AJS327]|uniref:DUF6457 domain-containing protein n=1 Tax=Streptomyces sp. AJS327 TaxID=2545265 RepID=UPI0015DDF7B3|nr:DUF6457 domain-containing protein [Streptomyces sp. AJS327]MBA0052781.1 molybdenum cofactor guanylyltransferase [Streptomyces sp. AJS327]